MLRVLDGRITGRPLTDIRLEDVVMLGVVFGSKLGGKALVVSGRDSTPVSRMLKRALTAGLMSVGCDVMDFHEAVNGEISFSMKRFGATGGFNIHVSPTRPGFITIRLYKAPGYELIGKNAVDVVSAISSPPGSTTTSIGWVNYAEYMHELYASALISFIKSDDVSAARLNIVASYSHGASGDILRKMMASLGLEHTLMSSGRVESGAYPMTSDMGKVALSTRAIGADIGVVFNIDASSLAVYLREIGFLLPEEILLAVLTRYPAGSSIVLEKNTSTTVARYLAEKGYHVKIVEDEEKFIETVRKERPVMALNSRGEFITPLFSLGYDAIVIFAQLLEALSLQRDEVYREVAAVRSLITSSQKNPRDVEALCSGENCIRTLWGFRALGKGVLETYMYNPESGSYVLFTEKTELS
ncbi:MAG: phosphoglucomutase [Desulfurococcus sp.]|nr:phosphoglucomutase [Desulfurococcus sp.]